MFLVIKKCSKKVVEKIAIWQHFLISGKHRVYPFLISVLCSSQTKNYIIIGLVINFSLHYARGRHLLCRKENTISVLAKNLRRKSRLRIIVLIFPFGISTHKYSWNFKYEWVNSCRVECVGLLDVKPGFELQARH